jgi:two-component sensor histidine kinase
MTASLADAAAVGLDDVIVTHELDRRPDTELDQRQVTAAIQELAAHMVDGPDRVLPRFVSLAMKLGGGVSSGISVSEPHAAPPVFRWAFLEGSLAAFNGATTPRNYSPCGVTLDANRPTLARHAERYYSWISDANIVVPEVLLVPLRRGEELLGTLWIVAEQVGHFNRGHVAAVSELAAFVSVALQMHQTETRLTQALAEQEAIAKEMSHRVKNVFNIVQGMIHFSARGAPSKEALAETLAGRVSALAAAHGLVQRSFGTAGSAVRTAELTALLSAILRPHEALPGRPARFTVTGPLQPLGEHATNGLALVLHELATNAAKYGALVTDAGSVEIVWTLADGTIVLTWRETGGPSIAHAPATSGFGMRLLQQTVSGFGGTVEHAWLAGGLQVTLRLPLERLGR